MGDSALLNNGPAQIDPAAADAAVSAVGSVVGVTDDEPGAGLVVGDPGLAASMDSGGAATATVSGAPANPVAPGESTSGAGDPVAPAVPFGGSAEWGGAAFGSADGALLGRADRPAPGRPPVVGHARL